MEDSLTRYKTLINDLNILKEDLKACDNLVKEIEDTPLIQKSLIKDTIKKMFDSQDNIEEILDQGLSLLEAAKAIVPDLLEFQRCYIFLKLYFDKFKNKQNI